MIGHSPGDIVSYSFYSQFKEKEINDQMLQQKGGGSVKGHIEQDLEGGADKSLRDRKL